MNDPKLEELEKTERLFFARAIFAAKLITWTTLLLLAFIIEAALVVRVFKFEFSPSSALTESSEITVSDCGRPGGKGKK